jgi:hypothetical protein
VMKGVGLGLLSVGLGLILLAWGPRPRSRLAVIERGGVR